MALGVEKRVHGGHGRKKVGGFPEKKGNRRDTIYKKKNEREHAQSEDIDPLFFVDWSFFFFPPSFPTKTLFFFQKFPPCGSAGPKTWI